MAIDTKALQSSALTYLATAPSGLRAAILGASNDSPAVVPWTDDTEANIKAELAKLLKTEDAAAVESLYMDNIDLFKMVNRYGFTVRQMNAVLQLADEDYSEVVHPTDEMAVELFQRVSGTAALSAAAGAGATES